MTVGRSSGRIGWGDLHALVIVVSPGQGVTVRRVDRAGGGAGEDGLDSHGKILSNAESTFAWQSKGQGFESPQLHSCGEASPQRIIAGQGSEPVGLAIL